MSSHNPLTQLRLLDTTSPTFHDQVSEILYGDEYTRWMLGLQGEDLMGLVDYLDDVCRCMSLFSFPLNPQQVLNALKPDSPAFRKCLRELRNICGPKMILPTSYTVSSQLSNISSDPVAPGDFADVHEGTLSGSKVCVKRVRIHPHKDSQKGPPKVSCPIASSGWCR